VAAPGIARAVSKLCLDLRNVSAKRMTNLEELAVRIMADLKALALLYSPSSFGKPLKIPLPAPAPSTPQIIGILQALYAYVKPFSEGKLRDYNNEKG